MERENICVFWQNGGCALRRIGLDAKQDCKGCRFDDEDATMLRKEWEHLLRNEEKSEI